ncbi:MAG: AMP-binding protein, partial [Thermoleophilia bacterium]|nr:AMP-binding protein [Thermoleophilia bacterium]
MTRTITDMWQQACTDAADRNAFMYSIEGEWKHVTYRTAYQRTAAIGAGLVEHGMKPGDHVSILADTCVDWTLCDYAVLGTGAALVPIYPTSSPAECEHILAHSKTTSIIVENAAQYFKIEEIRTSLPDLRQVIVMDIDGFDGRMGHDGLISLADIEAAGTTAGDTAWVASSKAVTPETTATIIYTSGTTGPPKGCLLQHLNVYATVETIRGLSDSLIRENDRVVLF